MKYKKGVTLIELLITIAIVSIIITPISLFFISNLKTLNETQIRLDLKDEGQKAIQLITKTAMDSAGIESISSEGDLNKEKVEIKFKGNSKQLSFTKGDKIVINNGESCDAKYITDITILDSDKDIIEIIVHMKNGKIEEKFNTKIAFRN